jgi:hypothetical protein
VSAQGKVRRMRPSPFHKGSGQAAAAKAAAPPAKSRLAPAAAHIIQDDSDADVRMLFPMPPSNVLLSSGQP